MGEKHSNQTQILKTHPSSTRKQTNHLDLFRSVVFKPNIMYTQKFTKDLWKHLAFHSYLVLHALKYWQIFCFQHCSWGSLTFLVLNMTELEKRSMYWQCRSYYKCHSWAIYKHFSLWNCGFFLLTILYFIWLFAVSEMLVHI